MGSEAATLLGSSTGSSLQERDFHKHESERLQDQQQDVSEVLKSYGLDPGLPVAALLSASAPVARCLRQAVRDSQLSISPDAPRVSLVCQQSVRAFFIARAADVKRDPPLIAACASDMRRLCANVTDGPGQIFHCLKRHKAQLQPLCRSSVLARQVASSEDIDLDAVLAARCSVDRNRLCSAAGWGDGAAQRCLEQVLHAELLTDTGASSATGVLGADAGGGAAGAGSGTTVGKAAAAGGGAGQNKLGLSPSCSSALFQRQIEESEDVRYNYVLSHACAGDKHMYCRDVRPGSGDVVGCLEQHAHLSAFSEACKQALEYNTRLRASDVRLDAHFRAVCARDVTALCLEVESKILTSVDEPPGAGARVMECMRRVREQIRAPACAQHVRSLMRQAYADNRLDVLLMDRCDDDASKLCIDKRSTISCLKTKLAKHVPLQPECAELVRERSRQAAGDLSFMPALQEACEVEAARYCGAKHLTPAQVIDCLADSRRERDFGAACREALISHLVDAVSDVRMLHTLRQDCKQDIDAVCGKLPPGEGRVLACLQQHRGNITSDACKRQMLRLMGLAVEDYRLDYATSQACKSDVQQLCAGVDQSDIGAVHSCLRLSMDHLQPECKKAQEALEAVEHEDVRLNPRIQKECPLAISMFCPEVDPGDANVMTCLQTVSARPDFPDACRAVMQSLLERSSLKYSLNFKLKAACDQDVASLCSGASDQSAITDSGVLGCLAANSSSLSIPCRSEMATLVRLHLNNYRMGMPLTSVCDGDVLARCNVDKQVTPFLLGGYILQCLSRSYSKLHTPCWSLISMFDEGQYQSAAQLESKPWTKELQKEAMDQMKQQVVAEVRGDLESKMLHNLEDKVGVAVEEQHSKIRPLVLALVNAASILMAVVAVLAMVAWFLWNKYVRRSADVRSRTVAIKDGRV